MLHLALPNNGNIVQVDKFSVEGDDNDYMLVRVAEYMLYDTTRSTGALAKAIKKYELPPTVALSDKTYAEQGVTNATFDAMKAAFQVFYSTIEPTQAKAPTRFAIVAVESIATIARAKHDQKVLELLGCEVPKAWVLAEQSRELAASGLVDLVLEDELQELREEDAVVAMGAELTIFEPYDNNDEDEQKVESYTLKRPGRHLNSQMQEFAVYQTAILQWMRAGGAVGQTTAASDASNFLRFAGWRVMVGGSNCKMDCLSELLTLVPGDMQHFCAFLVETRGVLHSTVANYLNSLLNVFSYVEANAEKLALLLGAPVQASQLRDVMLAAKNLRQQAESQAKQEKLFKPRKPDWISWADAKATREAAIAAFGAIDKTSARAKSLTVLEDVLIICFHTVMPPDRVGVVRRLSIDETLKKQAGSEHYYIDLTNFKHKTAKFYGPSMTPISELITPFLQQFMEATQSGFEFQEFDDDEEQQRTRRRYLFAMPTDATRCHESGNWTTRVKNAFRRHNPEGKAPCPSLLRSSFITELKNSTNDNNILGAAAIAQKHSVVMQGSDVYDLETHVRVTKAAMDWCDNYAAGEKSIEAAGAVSAAVDSNSGGPPVQEALAFEEGAGGETGQPAKRQRVA
jgi:hypothetical protein